MGGREDRAVELLPVKNPISAPGEMWGFLFFKKTILRSNAN